MLRVKLLEAGARTPVVAHPGEDLGYDVFALEGAGLGPRETVRVRTGIAVEARDPVTGARAGAAGAGPVVDGCAEGLRRRAA